jgi:hypothetical protein
VAASLSSPFRRRAPREPAPHGELAVKSGSSSGTQAGRAGGRPPEAPVVQGGAVLLGRGRTGAQARTPSSFSREAG